MDITIPHKFEPREYQLPFMRAMDEGYKRAVLVWHRRAGKDKTTVNVVIKKMLERVGTYYYVLPTYSQGKKIVWDGIDKDGLKFLDHFPKEIIKKKNEQNLSIEFLNGSIFQIIGSDKIDHLVGTNPVGVVFSEYAIQKPEVWDFIRPMLAENGGWAIWIYTPRGTNHGYKILQQAKNNKDWYWQVLTVDDTKAISKEVLEQEKKEMPAELYEQEYMCKFVDGAGQFFTNIDQTLHESDLPLPKGRRYQTGVDLAKYQDFTVLTAIDLANFYVYPQERFNQIDWTTQQMTIEAFLRKYNLPRCWMDGTGVGDPVVDNLRKKGLNIESFKFTEQSRMDLLNNLRIMIDQNKIKIPNDEMLIAELKSFQYSLTGQGKIKVQVPEGLHDDMVMSLALAVWELREYKIPETKTINIMLNKLSTDGQVEVGADME